MSDLGYEDMQSLCIYATRYALGRSSYAVSEVCDIVKRVELADNTMGVLLQDLERYFLDIEEGCNKHYMKCDWESWKELYKFLKEKKRQSV
jgi:hypothetical protein